MRGLLRRFSTFISPENKVVVVRNSSNSALVHAGWRLSSQKRQKARAVVGDAMNALKGLSCTQQVAAPLKQNPVQQAREYLKSLADQSTNTAAVGPQSDNAPVNQEKMGLYMQACRVTGSLSSLDLAKKQKIHGLLAANISKEDIKSELDKELHKAVDWYIDSCRRSQQILNLDPETEQRANNVLGMTPREFMQNFGHRPHRGATT